MNRGLLVFLRGCRDGMPICFGYFAVSFAFGIQARAIGISVLETGILCGTNLTSAGQFAALSIIQSAGSLLSLAATQVVINLRYCLMSCAIAQKLHPATTLWERALIAFGMTDEIFGVSIGAKGRLRAPYSYGLISVALPGWALGGACGAWAGNVLPALVTHALTMALYAMFVAVVVPETKRDRKVLAASVLAALLSIGAAYAPYVAALSAGMRVIVVTLTVSVLFAVLFPEREVK